MYEEFDKQIIELQPLFATDTEWKGKRAELGVYDDVWIHGDDGVEFIVPSPKTLHDKTTTERHKEISDKIDRILEQFPLDELKEKYGDLIG